LGPLERQSLQVALALLRVLVELGLRLVYTLSHMQHPAL
jgi:hypothetical protein